MSQPWEPHGEEQDDRPEDERPPGGPAPQDEGPNDTGEEAEGGTDAASVRDRSEDGRFRASPTQPPDRVREARGWPQRGEPEASGASPERGSSSEGASAPEGPRPTRELDDLVDAARSLDPGADALPEQIDPLAGAVPSGPSSPPSRPTGPGSVHGTSQPPSAPPAEAPGDVVGPDRQQGPGREQGAEAEVGQGQPDVLRPGGGPAVRRPARIIALANQKGGVGKTTSVINLGAALAELGNRVLLVDMDPQGSLGVGIGAEPHTLGKSVYNLLLNDGSSPDEVILQTAFDDLHVLPSNIDLAAAEIMLVQEVAREQSLRRVLERLRYRYDFILVDCPPSLGLLTINGLTAATGVIIPLECEYFALRGMTLLMNTIRKVQERLNPELEIEGILATMVDTRTLHAREVLERVHEAFGNLVFKSTINKTIRFAEAPVAGEPILTYAAENRGADAYRELAREVLSR